MNIQPLEDLLKAHIRAKDTTRRERVTALAREIFDLLEAGTEINELTQVLTITHERYLKTKDRI